MKATLVSIRVGDSIADAYVVDAETWGSLRLILREMIASLDLTCRDTDLAAIHTNRIEARATNLPNPPICP